jgi:aspartyl-tRNA(Asn)/glutamyl-tRNA(Gln) amidotransferase subunit A
MVATTQDLAYLTAVEVAALYRSRELSPVEFIRSLFERIEALQPTIRAYITVTAEVAMEEARAAEAALLRGEGGPLLGIPMAYKDIYMTAGVLTTAGSKVHERDVPAITATTVRKLHEAGAVMLGKLTTHEFAMGITPEEHPFPPARNPWNLERIPGGSSSGSGAALAAGIAVGTLGTDTGGSIRHPGCVCGIAALKPTYGRCSRYGVYTLSWSLDHTGPMARTVEDVALMLTAMAGYDPLDPASAQVPDEDYSLSLTSGVRGLKVGVMRSFYEPTAKPYVTAAVDEAVRAFAGLGAKIADVEIPSMELVKSSPAIMLPEAYSYHAPDLHETPEKYPAWLRNRLLSGGLYRGGEYVQAQRARQIVKEDFEKVLREVDVIVTPTRGDVAMTFPEAYEDYSRGPSYTPMYNMTGLPAISIPCGFADGLPIGLQIAGRPFDEATVLRVAYAYERATDWHTRRPTL